MTDLRKAAEEVTEAWSWDISEPRNKMLRERMETLCQALAQPEQEPVAWAHIEGNEIIEFETDKEECEACKYCVPLYTAPPKREWVGLTDEEIKEIVGFWGDTPIKGYTRKLFDQIESKLKEKNV